MDDDDRGQDPDQAAGDPPREDVLHAVPDEGQGERPVDRAHARAREAMEAMLPADERPDPEPQPLHRPRSIQTIALLLIGAVAGAFGVLTWQVEPKARLVVGVVAAIDPQAVAIQLAEPSPLAGQGIGVVGLMWREGAGEWERGLSDEGFPTCLSPDDVGQQVRIGLVSYPGGGDRPDAEAAVWLECAEE